MRLGILFFTEHGQRLAERIMELDRQDTFCVRPLSMPVPVFLDEKVGVCDGFLYIGAVGIAVRLMHPYIRSKDMDPAVVVMDEMGRFAISVLSGHLGGANELATRLAALTGAQAVITTATDIHHVFAADDWARKVGCQVEEIDQIKTISSALLRGQKIGFYSDFAVDGKLPDGLTAEVSAEAGIAVTLNTHKNPFSVTLHLVPVILSVGVGCRRGTASAAFEEFILQTLAEQGISMKAIYHLASLDLKKDEPCICHFVEKYRLPFITYTAAQLQQAEGTFTASSFVQTTTGVDNVCERSAVLGGNQLIMRKKAENGMTIALAVQNWRCVF